MKTYEIVKSNELSQVLQVVTVGDYSEVQVMLKSMPGCIARKCKAEVPVMSLPVAKEEGIVSPAGHITIFCDGSHSSATNRIGWAYAAILNGKVLHQDSGEVTGPDDIMSQRQIAGECTSAIKAVQWALSAGHGHVNLHYDYEGIAKWGKGEWKSKNRLTQRYAEVMGGYYTRGLVTFTKTDAHTGWNALVDGLAKAQSGAKL